MKIWGAQVDGKQVLFAEWWEFDGIMYPISGSILPFISNSSDFIEPLQNYYSFECAKIFEPSEEEKQWYSNRIRDRMSFLNERRVVKYFYKGEVVLFEVEKIDMKEGLVYAVQGSAYPSEKWQVIEEPLFCLTCYSINDAEKAIHEHSEGV